MRAWVGFMTFDSLATLSDSVRSSWQTMSLCALVRKIAQWSTMLPKIASFEEELQELGTYVLRKRSLSLRYRIRSHEPVDKILPEAFALVGEAGAAR